MLKSFFFYGYTKKSVEDTLDSLYDKLSALTHELERKEQTIADLTEQVRRAKSEEALIQEAIIDAKDMSKRLIQEAQEQAQLLMAYVEEDINSKLDKVSTDIHTLKENKSSMLSQESQARQQLKASLNHYLALIDRHSDQFAIQNNILEVDFQQVEHSISETRHLLQRTSSAQKEALLTKSRNNIIALKRAQG